MHRLLLFIVAALCALAGTVVFVQPAGAETTVRVLSGAVGNELELMRQACARYTAAHPDVTISILDIPHAVEERRQLYLRFLEDESPDIDLYQIDIIWPGDLAEHFLDLRPHLPEEVEDQFFPTLIKANTVDGRLVALPMFTSAGLLYYRTDLLKKYGLEVPGTWDDLEHAAAVIQRGERAAGNPAFHGFIFQADAYEGLTCTALEWLVSNNAGAIISQDKRVTVDNPAAAEMLGRAARWVGSIAPRAVTTFKEENCRNLWQGGNAAFMRNWPYCYTLGNAPDSPIRGKFGVAPVPAGQGSNAGTLGGWQMAVSRYTRHPGLASDIAAHLCSRPIQKLRATHGSFNPTVPDLYSDPDVLSANPFLGKLLDVFVNAVARPSNVTGKDYPEVSRIFYTNVHAVITGDMAPASACRQISHDIQALTGFEAGPPTTRQER